MTSWKKKLAGPIWERCVLPIGKSIIERELQRRGGLDMELEFRSWLATEQPRLGRFRDLHKGETCFIMGNGPSLNKMDLTQLQGVHVFGLNKIHLLLETVPLQLSYHVAVNPLVLEQSMVDFERLHCPSFLAYQNCPANSPKGGKWNYIYTKDAPFAFSPITGRINEGWTVTFVALQIAFFMGFSRVFLIGVDHNFKAVGQPNEKQLLVGDDPNHFAPNYFGGKEWHLPDLEGSEMAYKLAKFEFERSGRQIMDATLGGKCDIFPKIAFSEAVAVARQESHQRQLTVTP